MPINIKYQPLYTSKKRYIYVNGGRASGKSHTVADFIVKLTYSRGHKILYTRYTMTSAEKSIIPEFEEKIDNLGVRQHFKIRKNTIKNTKTGVEIIFLGIKGSSGNQTARLKSIKGITTWVYDEFEEHPDERTFDVIDQSIREKNYQNRIILISNALHKDSWQYKRFLDPIYRHGIDERGYPKVLSNTKFKGRRKILDDHHTEVIHTTYLDNINNLNEQYVDLIRALKGSRKYDIDFLGMHYDTTDGALWNYESFIHLDDPPKSMMKIVVAIDPAVTANADSDETGIVVCGKGFDDKYYVLADHTGRYTPNQWASISCRLYHQWDANEVVCETNNGGDLVESNIRNYDSTVHVRQVKASRGKIMRAEPVAALYEQRKVIHCGKLHKLEQEMATWSPELSDKSPDRLDALVWGLTRLSKRKRLFVV